MPSRENYGGWWDTIHATQEGVAVIIHSPPAVAGIDPVGKRLAARAPARVRTTLGGKPVDHPPAAQPRASQGRTSVVSEGRARQQITTQTVPVPHRTIARYPPRAPQLRRAGSRNRMARAGPSHGRPLLRNAGAWQTYTITYVEHRDVYMKGGGIGDGNNGHGRILPPQVTGVLGDWPLIRAGRWDRIARSLPAWPAGGI